MGTWWAPCRLSRTKPGAGQQGREYFGVYIGQAVRGRLVLQSQELRCLEKPLGDFGLGELTANLEGIGFL